jgi:hypothetical protein
MKIAQLDAQIQANHFSNVQLFNDLTEAQRELGLLQGSRPTCPFLRPHFISRQQYNEISHVAEVLHTAFEAMTNVALENAEMLSLLDLTEAEERMARINPGYKNLCVTSRLDTFLCGEDFKFLEYNAESPAGIGDQMQLEIVLEKIPKSKIFLQITNIGDQNHTLFCSNLCFWLIVNLAEKRKSQTLLLLIGKTLRQVQSL